VRSDGVHRGTLLPCGGLLLRNTDLAALLSYSKKLRLFEAAGEIEQTVGIVCALKVQTVGIVCALKVQIVGIVCALKVQSDEALREEAGKCAEVFDTLADP
jgi:hypothetical protein